ncbi:hypothetical protein ACQ4LE_003409 [Meloidogyne hapla]|uniref:Transposase n=1 Tax=Meloidogyne hapla TaxID=6305 RepID=A0A1I8B8W8_MELHA
MPEDEKLKWKTLVEGLAKRLRKVSNKEAARMKLAGRKQKLREAVEEYAQHLMNLVDFAYPEDSFGMDFSSLKLTDEQKTSLKDENDKMTRRFKEQTVIDSFKTGHLPETKGKMIFLSPPTSLAEAVAQARKIGVK